MKLRNLFKRKKSGCTDLEQRQWCVEWYERHGKYPDRIKGTKENRYVQIDRIWNKQNPIRKETVRHLLADYVAYKVTGISRK